MQVKAIAPWFGSKRKMAPKIVEVLGNHRAYWEPFCGSMAVLLAKPPSTMETVNDLHGDLINLARVIQHPKDGPAFYRRLRRVWASEAAFKDAASRFRDQPNGERDVERAIDYFIASWLGRNGIAGTNIGQKRGAGHSFCVRYTSGGGDPATRWKNAIDSIPAWHRRLRDVTILNRDAFEIIGNIEDKEGTVIYVDPPYLDETRSGKKKASGGTSSYRHDFVSPDHEKLSQALSRFQRTRVVVSYYDHLELERLYPGWKKIDCATSKAITNTAKSSSRVAADAPEVLLVNDRQQGLFA